MFLCVPLNPLTTESIVELLSKNEDDVPGVVEKLENYRAKRDCTIPVREGIEIKVKLGEVILAVNPSTRMVGLVDIEGSLDVQQNIVPTWKSN